MNKSLFTKLFIPIGLLGVVVILVVLLAVSQDFLQDLLVPVIIWIPVWAVVSLALTILDGKKHLGLDGKLSKIMGKKSKSKEKPVEKPVETEEKPTVDIAEVVTDVVTPPVKFDKPISTIVIFDNAAVKDSFKTFCDNGFKLGENPKNVPKPDPLFVTEEKPVKVEKELPELIFILDDETVSSFVSENQADILVRDSAEIVKPEIKIVTDVPVVDAHPIVEDKPAEEKPAEEKPEKKVPPAVAKLSKFSLFKKPKSKTKEIEENEEAIFDPVKTDPRVKKYSPSVITDERLVKIVKNPELITPAELALINGNVDLKKRYYELMTALYDEDD